jgi:iron complex outermembrane recepter protein
MHAKFMQWIVAGAFSAFMLMPASAPAQTGDTLEEIVVTARKRDESLHDVPVAVNAFSAADIEAAGIERPQDFIALTPNVTMVQTQNQGTSFITVRGISQARNSEPSVAVLIDGVLLANPSQFNQELYDIDHIEVLKGPQGALYGRNAIGGAIIIRTREPGDELAGKLQVGYDSGPGYKVRAGLGGPLNSSGTVKFMASGSYFKTDGYIDNAFLHQEADPFKDASGRLKLLWQPSEAFKADFRAYYSQVDTQALYFNITESVNDTSLPVRVNNPGVNQRKLRGGSVKLDFDTGIGTLTSISAYDHVDELLTGDQFNFLPIPESVLFQFFGADQAQHQWLDVDSYSQEVRLASASDARVRWIVGAYYITTDRFISTGNVFDLGTGTVPEVKRTPLPIFAPQFTFLADHQSNRAWAAFADASFDITPQLEGDISLRYDNDRRENRTDTPTAFIPAPLAGVAFTGQIRTKEWDDLQPKLTLRYRPSERWNVYGGYSRGFRSGGFNQTGVGSAGIAGINDLFDQETADTFEVGAKGQFADRRVNTSFNVYHTTAKGSYFFVFDPTTSTQNLGNLGKVVYRGAEFEISARAAEGLDLYLRLGTTHSEIKESTRAPTDVGNQAPLVSKYTGNVGMQYRHALAPGGLQGLVRLDFERIGPTYWYPDNYTVRDPVNLLNLRLGIEKDAWSLTAWAKNLTDEKYNAEWSPGPQFFPNPGETNNFVFKALPRVWGVDFNYRF